MKLSTFKFQNEPVKTKFKAPVLTISLVAFYAFFQVKSQAYFTDATNLYLFIHICAKFQTKKERKSCHLPRAPSESAPTLVPSPSRVTPLSDQIKPKKC
jgi:hypothetical protein